MVGWNVIITFASLACLVAGFPTEEIRYKRSPLDARSMMVRGYFRGQPIAGYNLDPRVMMTAYSLRNTVAAGSYQGANQGEDVKPACENARKCQEAGIIQPTEDKPDEEETQKWGPNVTPLAENPPVGTQDGDKDETENRRAKAPKAPKRRPSEEEDEEDDEPSQGAPTFSRFFPMSFNYPGSYGRSGEESGPAPGVATAISNSFSQGKGAIASSQATAFGGSDPNQYRKSLENRRRRY